jgi:hypothetical protein
MDPLAKYLCGTGIFLFFVAIYQFLMFRSAWYRDQDPGLDDLVLAYRFRFVFLHQDLSKRCRVHRLRCCLALVGSFALWNLGAFLPAL